MFGVFIVIMYPAGAIVKIILTYVTVDKIRVLLDQIKLNWLSCTGEQEIQIMKEHANMGRIYTMCYVYYSFTSLAMFMTILAVPSFLDVIIPLNHTRSRNLPFQVEFFVDPRKYYYPIFIHSLLTGYITLIVVCGGESMFLLCMHQNCGMFTTLGYHLQQIMYKNSSEEKMLMMSSWKSNQTLKYIALVGGQLCHLFINCHISQKLIDKSSNISAEIYTGRWYNAPLRVQKLLLSMMIGSSKPCVITAGKFWVLSMATYGTLLETAVSYCTVLSQVR
ncbi:hypothetical protein KM043_008630 [Ampulex compressa]|nr:hypothetical protein KM043_008630 [Ampulex compressa]